MKKLSIITFLILVTGIISANAQCCSTKAKKQITAKTCCSDQKTDTTVKAYYFHATRRCATCEAVETVSKKTIAENYKGKVSFQSINREENKDNPLVKKYKISGQTLLIVKGDKTVNLTNAAFLNARTKPEKLVDKLKSTINDLL